MPPPQVAEQGPHSPVFHLQVTESSKQIMAQLNGMEVSAVSVLQSDKENVFFAEQSQRQVPISPSTAQLDWLCKA